MLIAQPPAFIEWPAGAIVAGALSVARHQFVIVRQVLIIAEPAVVIVAAKQPVAKCASCIVQWVKAIV
jgi:hypothetical protein